MKRWLLALGLSAAACAGAQPAPRPPAAVHHAEPPPPTREAPLDTSVVAEPQSLLLAARIDGPALRNSNLLPPGNGLEENPLRLIDRRLPGLARELFAEAPIELALGVQSAAELVAGGPDVVVSIAVVSFAATRAALESLALAGEVELGRSTRERLAFTATASAAPTACWLAVARGPTRARLICGTSVDALERLGPYAARGLPTRELGPEPLVVVLYPRRVPKLELEKLRNLSRVLVARQNDSAGLERALPVLLDDALELWSDLAELRLSARAGEPSRPGAELELEAVLEGRKAWTTRTLATLQPRNSELVAMFRSLPDDTDFAGFFSGASLARADEAQASLEQWLRAEWGASVSRESLELVVRTFLQRGPYLYAQGDAFGKDTTSVRHSGRGLWEKTLSVYGWHLIGFPGRSAELALMLDRGMNAYNRGDLGKLAYRELPRLCAGLGKIRKKPAPRGFPRGSAVYQLPLPGKFFDDCVRHWRVQPPERAPNDSIVVVLLPDGERTWVGFGIQEGPMLARMAQLTKKPARPAERFPPEAWRDADVRGGGFTSLAGIGGLLRFVSMSEPWGWRRERLGRLPARGKEPMAFSFEVSRDAPTRLRARLWMSRGAFEDLSAF